MEGDEILTPATPRSRRRIIVDSRSTIGFECTAQKVQHTVFVTHSK